MIMLVIGGIVLFVQLKGSSKKMNYVLVTVDNNEAHDIADNKKDTIYIDDYDNMNFIENYDSAVTTTSESPTTTQYSNKLINSAANYKLIDDSNDWDESGSGDNSRQYNEKRISKKFHHNQEHRELRILGNLKKSGERSRQLLLCQQSGGGELCRMLFKEDY